MGPSRMQCSHTNVVLLDGLEVLIMLSLAIVCMKISLTIHSRLNAMLLMFLVCKTIAHLGLTWSTKSVTVKMIYREQEKTVYEDILMMKTSLLTSLSGGLSENDVLVL